MRLAIVVATLTLAGAARVDIYAHAATASDNEETIAVAAESQEEAQKARAAEDQRAGALAGGMQSGDLFLDQYRLDSLLHSGDWPRAGLPNFKQISYLGSGAFGETWLAFDQKNQRSVAIKFFYRKLPRGGVQLLNMMNAYPEEKAALQTAGTECDTPKNIISGKDFSAGQARFAQCFENNVNHRDHAHLILEVAGTQNLNEFLNENRRIPDALILRLAKMALEGLAQMEGKFVHRDIKPDNIMVYKDTEDQQYYLKYIDFGLTVRDGSHASVAGTPLFLPPEMWPNVPRDPVSTHAFDVYSLGETLYQVLCGRTFHEYIFDRYGDEQDMRKLQGHLVNEDPKGFCNPRSDGLLDFANEVMGKMMVGHPNGRSSATELLKSGIYAGIQTMKQTKQPDPYRDPYARKPVAAKPKSEVVPLPQEVKRVEPTFLQKCHADKRFWFQNVKECCLKELYDPVRDAYCQRPCGPKVPYNKGSRDCADNCFISAKEQHMWSEPLSCCVAVIWQTKCLYRQEVGKLKGAGWGWA